MEKLYGNAIVGQSGGPTAAINATLAGVIRGAIECEARKRADDLERATVLQLQQTLDLFRQQYQTLMSTFETTAGYVTGELRKVEVNLSQLPRAMDRPGTELNELAARLEQIKQEKSQ